LKRMDDSKQFEENRQRILSDANYTLAIIQNKIGGGSKKTNKADDIIELD
jgi:hypothetical protein